MGTRTSNNASDFQKAPQGMHLARCFKIVDCGTHINPKYGTKQRIGWLFFELPNSLMDADDKGERKPFVIGKRYTLSHSEMARLRADLESWYGKQFNTAELDKAGGFDLEKLIGRSAMINIIHSEDGKYANIKSINPMPDGIQCPEQVNNPFTFWVPDDFHRIGELSEKMASYIKESFEYIGEDKQIMETASPSQPPVFDDDIPF